VHSSDLVRAELAAASGKNSTHTDAAMAHELVVEFVVGAFMAVMNWWLDGGAKLPPRQIDAMFRRLAIEGAVPPYGHSPNRDNLQPRPRRPKSTNILNSGSGKFMSF
jgi:hypothetical protein